MGALLDWAARPCRAEDCLIVFVSAERRRLGWTLCAFRMAHPGSIAARWKPAYLKLVPATSAVRSRGDAWQKLSRSRSCSTIGLLRTAGRSRSCWRSAACRTLCTRSILGRATSSSPSFWRSRRTIACRRLLIRKVPAESRFRCSSRARSCNTSAARPANSIPPRNAPGERARRGWSWQVGNLGPMAGQAHHFRTYAPEQIPYAVNRYTNECNRLYGVMNNRLAKHPYLAGKEYTIADMAAVGGAKLWEGPGPDPAQFAH